MKICFLTDGRSPISQNWIRYFIDLGHDVSVISSHPCERSAFSGATVHEIPIGFGNLAPRKSTKIGKQAQSRKGNPGSSSLLTMLLQSPLQGIVKRMRLWLTPLDMRRHVGKTQRILAELDPDLVHAMRIPFEGIFAMRVVPTSVPLLISVWGNDFTLHAAQNAQLDRLTRQALQRANALHTDCRRDLHLARDRWNFSESKPAIVLPGSGGVQSHLFHPGVADESLKKQFDLPDDAQIVINPRGFREYVCNESFFHAIPLVVAKQPNVIFLMSAMQGNAVAERWSQVLGIENNVRLLPLLPRAEMGAIFRTAAITLSPSLHDGTPNTLLEAMACGCFPVAGDIESVREWIVDGENGLLCDPRSPEQIAEAILQALENDNLRQQAQRINQALIAEQADYQKVMAAAEEFYSTVTL